MPSHLPNLSGDVPRQQGSTWVDPYGAELGLFEAETILTSAQDLETLGPPEGQRRHERLVAPPCRPVPIQLLQPDGAPRTEWFYADILDISLGGLCLLITESHTIEVGQSVLVDFKAHRTSDLHRVPGLVRWFVRSGTVTTMGLGFADPLRDLPELLPERRTRLRNPNEEPKT
ncbi:PilZ domain-containing protein [Cyanobium sp. T1B-Tous]|uniref:PilZ domain-containing protein n=1 Tax=Cyanobium sp. T1B-Tous TaxID=2823721 RepID=UPI0020CED731|nr:PilZ domain-containing protein [Cyanobium sp. T1B-Tous]MCP9807098.1 PilZ domain-containing protein [Cyanobium sp. T1B-Tous]